MSASGHVHTCALGRGFRACGMYWGCMCWGDRGLGQKGRSLTAVLGKLFEMKVLNHVCLGHIWKWEDKYRIWKENKREMANISLWVVAMESWHLLRELRSSQSKWPGLERRDFVPNKGRKTYMVNNIALCGCVCGGCGGFTSSLAAAASCKIIKDDGKQDRHICLLHGQSERPASTTPLHGRPSFTRCCGIPPWLDSRLVTPACIIQGKFMQRHKRAQRALSRAEVKT